MNKVTGIIIGLVSLLGIVFFVTKNKKNAKNTSELQKEGALKRDNNSSAVNEDEEETASVNHGGFDQYVDVETNHSDSVNEEEDTSDTLTEGNKDINILDNTDIESWDSSSLDDFSNDSVSNTKYLDYTYSQLPESFKRNIVTNASINPTQWMLFLQGYGWSSGINPTDFSKMIWDKNKAFRLDVISSWSK